MKDEDIFLWPTEIDYIIIKIIIITVLWNPISIRNLYVYPNVYDKHNIIVWKSLKCNMAVYMDSYIISQNAYIKGLD